MIPRDQTSADEKDRTRRLQRTASGLLYAVLVAVAIWMIRDFIPAVVWAAVIAIALWPLLTWLEQRPLFRERSTWLAVVLTVVIGLVFVVPFILVVAQAGSEARDLMALVSRIAAHRHSHAGSRQSSARRVDSR